MFTAVRHGEIQAQGASADRLRSEVSAVGSQHTESGWTGGSLENCEFADLGVTYENSASEFPVSPSREFARKSRVFAAESAAKRRRAAPVSDRFRVFFP